MFLTVFWLISEKYKGLWCMLHKHCGSWNSGYVFHFLMTFISIFITLHNFIFILWSYSDVWSGMSDFICKGFALSKSLSHIHRRMKFIQCLGHSFSYDISYDICNNNYNIQHNLFFILGSCSSVWTNICHSFYRDICNHIHNI